MSHRRGQHEDSSHDATAGHSNTMPTTKMSAKDRLRQEEEQLDKLLTECGCGTDGMSLEDKRQLGAVLQTSKDDAVHEKHVRDLYEEQESFTHRSGITNGDSVHIDGHDISLDEDTDVTDVPHTDSSAVKRVNFSLQCSMSQDSTSDKDSDKESEGEIANNVSLQCSRTESEPDDNQEVGTDSNDANIKSCSDDDSEYCSLSESEEEKKSDGNHLSVEKSVKTEFIKLKEEFVSSPVLGKKQKPEISKRLSKAQASKMKSVFLESDSDDSEIFDVSTSKTTNHNTNNAPINKHLVIASDSDSDSPPKKRHCTLNMQHQKSSSPVFEPEQDNINDTSTSMSDSDAFVGDSFSMISPSPLARQPLRRMQKKTESSIGAGSDVSVICETQPDMLNSSIDSSMGVSEHSYSVLDTNEETVINKAKNVDKSGSTPTVDTQDPLYSSNEGESKHHSVVSESQDLIDEESDADESATFDPSKMAALPGSDSELDGDATQDDSGLVGNSQNEQEADSSMKESDGSDAEEYVANTQDISGVKKIDHEGGMDVIAESQDIDVDNQSEQSECLFGGLSQIASFITSKNSSLDNDTAAEIGSSADDMPKLEMSADSSESERTTHRSADSLQCGQTVVTTADHSEDVELTSSMTMNSGSSEMDTVVEANKLDNQESSKPSVSDDIQIEEEEGLDLIGRLKHTQLKSPLLNPPSCHTTPTISAQVSPQPTISAQASPQPKTLKRHYKEPRLYDDKPYYSRDPLKTEAYASTIRGYFSTYHAMLAQAQARVQCHMPWSEPITSFSSKKTTTATNSRAERAQQRAARHNPIYVDVLSDGSDFEDDRLNAKKTSQRTNNDARGGFKSLSRLQRNRKDDVHEESDDLPDTEPMLLDDVSGDNAGSVRNRRHTSDSIGSGRSNASSSKPSSIASTNSTQQQQLIDELRTKHAQICRSPTGTKPGGSPGSDSGSTGPIGSSTPAPLRRRHSESITKLSHSSQQLASQHENIPNEGVSEESCHPVTSPISCTAPTPLRRGSTVQIPITSTQPPELCDTSSYIKRPDNRKIPARRCMLLEADIPRRHSSASTTGNKRKLLKIGYSDYRLDDDVGVSTLDVSRGEKERLNPEDQNEGKRHGVSKGLKRVVSDIDVTRKHRNTISNMTLSDINLGCTTAGSISTVSSTSSTTTSISESASLSPASSVFGVGSKQPDANIRTYASRGRGRRGRPPTRGSTLTVENLREHLAETIDLDSERESEKCGPTTKPRRRKKMFYDSDSEAESDSDYLPGPKTKKQVAKQVAKKGVTGTQKISGNHMHVVVVDIHRAEDSSKDSPKPKRKIAPSGPASAPSSADKESKKPAYRLAIDEMDTIEVDENYVQSPVKRGLKNLTRKRAAQDESRVAKKQRVEAESKTLKLVSEGESEFSDFDTGEMLSRRLNSKRHLANVRKQESAKKESAKKESAKKESAKKESAKKESAKKELVMMKKGSTKKDTGVSKKDSVKRGTSEKKKGSSKKEEGLNKNPNKSGKKKGPGESAQPKRGSKKLFTDSESDDEKSVDRKSKNEKPKVKDATASKIRSAAKSVKLLKTTATTKKNIVSEEKERKKEQEHKKSKTLSKDKTGDKEEQVADNTKNKPTKRGKKGGKVVPKKFAPIIQQSFLDISLSESDSEMAPPPAKIASTKSKHEVLRKDRPSRRALMDSADEMPVESICSPEIGRTRRGHAKMDVPPVVLNDSSNIKQSSKPKSKPVQNVQPSIRSSVRSSPRAAAVSANRDQVSRAGSSVPSTSKSSVNNDTSSDDCERLSRSRRSTEKVNYKALSQGQSEDENERGNSKKDASEKGGKKSTQELKCSAVKDKKSSKEKEDGPQMIECPMCYKSFTSDGIAEHASNCVGKTPAPSTRSPRQRQAKGNIDKDADNTDNKRLSMSTCPMCYDMFEQSKLQAHVNRCVEKAEENADLAVNKRQTRTRKT